MITNGAQKYYYHTPFPLHILFCETTPVGACTDLHIKSTILFSEDSIMMNVALISINRHKNNKIMITLIINYYIIYYPFPLPKHVFPYEIIVKYNALTSYTTVNFLFC